MRGIKGEKDSGTQRMSRLFRFINNMAKKGSDALLSIPDVAMRARAAQLEVELKRAKMLNYWQRWLNKPK